MRGYITELYEALENHEDEYLRSVMRITEDIVRKGKLLLDTIKI